MTVAFMKPAHDKYCTRYWKYTLGKCLQIMQNNQVSSPYGVTQLMCRILTGTKTRYPRRGAGKTAVVSKKRDKSRQGSTDSTSPAVWAGIEPECQHTIQAAW